MAASACMGGVGLEVELHRVADVLPDLGRPVVGEGKALELEAQDERRLQRENNGQGATGHVEDGK